MADKSKRPPRIDLKNPDGKFGRLVQIGGTAIVVIFAVVLVFYIVTSHQDKKNSAPVTGQGDTVRVTSSKLVTKPGSTDPKAVVLVYEDFLCPVCGNFERTIGPTMSKLIDIGAIAVDYAPVAILDNKPGTHHYSSRAAAATLCVADESVDAFRRFHNHLYDEAIQPKEDGSTGFPDNARLIELAREAGAVGTVPACINSGKYVDKVLGATRAAPIQGTPTITINGEEYEPSTPQDLVAKIKGIVGDVPGIDTAVAPAAS